MLYHYVAIDTKGTLQESEYDADNLEAVLRYLSTKELRPVSVKPVKQESGIKLFQGRITIADKVFLTKYISLMLSVGTDLLMAINILIADFEKPAIKNFLLEVRESLSRGRPFYEAFAKHPKVFSKVFVSLIKAAEASGNLQKTFQELSTSMEREAELRSKIKSAFIYPAIILTASLGIFLFLVMFALPKIANVFMQGGIQPPLFSRIVFSIGLFVGGNMVGFLVALFGIVGFGLYFVFFNEFGKALTSKILSHTPIISKLYEEIAVQRFAATFSSLLKAGLPIIDALKITADVVGSVDFRVALLRIADEGLAKGLTIGESFRREAVFPKVVSNLIAVSERAGHIEEVLETLSEFYATNIDSSVKTLVSFIEPALLLFMGILVGSIALAIIVPIYQLTSQF